MSTFSHKPIYLSAPAVTDADMAAVQTAMASGWVSTVGPALTAFEQSLTSHAGSGAVVALSSGTAAIHLGLKLLGVGPGDLVVVPSLTFAATLNPVLYLGATPVLVDSDADTGNICPQALEETLTQLKKAGTPAKAICVVHLYGVVADMDAIMSLAEDHGCLVLEDAAEAMGSSYHGKPAGTLAHAGVWSFNGNKLLTTSGGGALWVPDEDKAAKVRNWATQARQPVIWYQHEEVGYNYRMSNLLAALGNSQLLRLPELVAHRRQVHTWYQELLAPFGWEALGGPSLPLLGQSSAEHVSAKQPQGSTSNSWLPVFGFPASTEGGGAETAEPSTGPIALAERLMTEAIELRPVWKPMHLQPYLLPLHNQDHGFPAAEAWFRTGICLPSGPRVGSQEVERVVERLLYHQGKVQ